MEKRWRSLFTYTCLLPVPNPGRGPSRAAHPHVHCHKGVLHKYAALQWHEYSFIHKEMTLLACVHSVLVPAFSSESTDSETQSAAGKINSSRHPREYLPVLSCWERTPSARVSLGSSPATPSFCSHKYLPYRQTILFAMPALYSAVFCIHTFWYTL